MSYVPSEILLEILSNPVEIASNPIHPMLTAAASSHALKTAPQRSPSGRFRNSKMALKDGTTSKSIARTSSLGAGMSLLKSY